MGERRARWGTWHLLARDGHFRALWGARAVSFLGDSFGLVALLLYVKLGVGAAVAVALLLLAGDLVPGLLGPVTGAVADRVDRKHLMVGCELGQGALTLLVALVVPGLPVLLPLVALRAVLGQLFATASRSAVPALVPDARLEAANSAIGSATHGLEALGPLVAAALLGYLDVRGVLLADAATFAVSAALLTRLPALPPVAGAGRGGLLRDSRAGLGHLWSDRVLRVIAGGFLAVVLFSGVDDVALVFLAEDTLGASHSGAALLYAGAGIGLLAGYPLMARYGTAANGPVMLLAGFAVSSAGNLGTGLAWAVGVAFAMQAMRGLGLAALDVSLNSHLQRTAPALMNRVFGALYGAVGVAAGLSYLLGGPLLDLTSARFVFVAAGAGGLAATALTAVLLARVSRSGRGGGGTPARSRRSLRERAAR